jgi:hypothetical protein
MASAHHLRIIYAKLGENQVISVLKSHATWPKAIFLNPTSVCFIFDVA